MSTAGVRLESRGALALLTIGAPPLNRIDAQVIAGLRAALDEVERAEGLRALVLRGAGDVFSAGADVSLFDGLGPDQAEELIGGFLELGDRIERLPFPTLAAAHGQCIAGGLALALFCDLLWCAEGTLIGLPEARLGIMPLAGGVQRHRHLRLGRREGRHRVPPRRPARCLACRSVTRRIVIRRGL